MKDGIILALILFVAGLTFFWGMTLLFSKAIKSTPKIERDEEYTSMMRDQRRKMEELQEKQRQSMRDQQQRIRDLQRL